MRFMIEHSMEAGCTRQRVEELRAKMTMVPDIKWYRSFLNLSLGRGMCLFDAPDHDRLVEFLQANDLPYDRIWPVELESEFGNIVEMPAAATTGVSP